MERSQVGGTTLSRVWQAGDVWAASEFAKHQTLRVADPTWVELRMSIREAEKELFGYGDEFNDVYQLVRRLGFQLSCLPLPAGHPLIWGGEAGPVIDRLITHGHTHQLESVIAVGMRLKKIIDGGSDSPLWSALVRSWVSLERPIVLVARKQSEVGPLESRIDTLPGTPVPIVATMSELPHVWNRKTTVVFGPPSLYPAWLKAFPRNDVLWIYHAWNRDVEVPSSLLSLAQGTASPRNIEPHGKSFSGTVSTLDLTADENVTYTMSQERVEREIRQHASPDDDTTVPARIALLANDDCVLLPVDDGTTVTVFDPNESRIRREATRRIVPGMFVVVRERGGRDHIRALVESKFMDDPAEAKARLEGWKLALRTKIRAQGISTVKRELEALGVAVEPGTIILWTTELIHGPGKEEWFRSLSAYLDLGGAEENWEILVRLRRAGRKAGLYMRDQLVKQATEVDPVTARRSSTLKFTIDGVDGGALIAHKVEEVLPEVIQAPPELIGQPIEGTSA